MSVTIERFEPGVDAAVAEDLRERLGRTHWPSQPEGIGWELGVDVEYLQGLCKHWAEEYDFGRLGRIMGEYENGRWNGVHFLQARGEGEGLPIVLVHGWPGGVIEFTKLIPMLTAAGHDVVVPSLPGYGFSDELDLPPNATRVATLLGDLIAELGYERYALQGGDWGSPISFQLALQAPDRVAALHLNAVSVLPAPPDLTDPPLTEAEQAFVQRGLAWRAREGHHVLLHSTAPDAASIAFGDSPAGLAAWLVEKYRNWSDCDGDVERRFSKDELCDFFTLYWATGTIASSMRLYWGERRERSRLGPGEKVAVPAAVADFPKEIVPAPRDWAERMLADLRRWTEMPRGGHFAAFEEPELLAEDALAFLDEVDGA